MSWLPLDGEEKLAAIIASSKHSEKPIAIFKHSTRCGVSSAAKRLVENSEPFTNNTFQIYYLDLLSFRDISNNIADLFQVQHESPQLLFIKDGECIYHISHGAISGRSFEKVMNFV